MIPTQPARLLRRFCFLSVFKDSKTLLFLPPKFLAAFCSLLVPAGAPLTILLFLHISSQLMIFTYPQITELMRVMYTGFRNTCLSDLAQCFLLVTVAGIHLSLEPDHEDLLFQGIGWLEEGICNSFLFVNIHQAWEHVHAPYIQGLCSAFSPVFQCICNILLLVNTNTGLTIFNCFSAFAQSYSIKSFLSHIINQVRVQL